MKSDNKNKQITVAQDIDIELFNTFELEENNGFSLSQFLAIRCNCQMGQFTKSDQKPIGNEMEVSIIKVEKYFGTLGLTENEEWIQIWFIPKCDFLPPDVICYTYIKTRSITSLQEKVIDIRKVQRLNPQIGIFKIGFEKHKGRLGDYYSVTFDWRERNSEAEIEELKAIGELLKCQPVLQDLAGTKYMELVDVNANGYRPHVIEPQRGK